MPDWRRGWICFKATSGNKWRLHAARSARRVRANAPWFLLGLLFVLAGLPQWADAADAPIYESELIFPLNPKHNHAPGVAELPSGELVVSWYRGSGERSAD